MKRITSLVSGERVTGIFHGTKSLGNETHSEPLVFESLTGAGDGMVATFSDSNASTFDVYRYNGRWAYGTSADKFSIAPAK